MTDRAPGGRGSEKGTWEAMMMASQDVPPPPVRAQQTAGSFPAAAAAAHPIPALMGAAPFAQPWPFAPVPAGQAAFGGYCPPQLDPSVLALMQNPALAYKVLHTLIAQQQMQQQQTAPPPPPVYQIPPVAAAQMMAAAAASDAFVRQQMQYHHHHHHHHQQQQQQQEELSNTLKSLSLDDSPASTADEDRPAPKPRHHSPIRAAGGRWDAIRDLAHSYRQRPNKGQQLAAAAAHPPATEEQGMLPRNAHLESSLFGHPSAAINFGQYEKIPVEVCGFDGCEPVSSFSDASAAAWTLHPIVSANIVLAAYDKPTPVQKYTIPAITAGRDIMACAQTGSGKTAAFLLPIINRMMTGSMLCRLGGGGGGGGGAMMQSPRCLILAPTRELCIQIFNEARKFSYRSLMRVVVVYGGTNLRQQMKEIYRGVDLVVATPGRLIDVVERSCLRLDAVRFLVLDEADRMLDMGFEPQIRRIVDGLDMPPKQSRQTSMFSATFPKPIRELAKQFLSDYIFLCVGRIGSTSESIQQRVEFVQDADKVEHLVQILSGGQADSCLSLVFVETKRSADELEMLLRKRGFNAACIHGDRSQSDREYALNQFRNGHVSVLVATADMFTLLPLIQYVIASEREELYLANVGQPVRLLYLHVVAARGLDVPSVYHVINYDLPTDIDDYVHRIGRTGRGGNEGLATSFFNDRNANIAADLVAILTESKQEIPNFLRHMQDAGRYRRYDNRRRQNYRGARSATYSSSSSGRQNFPNRQLTAGTTTMTTRPPPSIATLGRRFSATANNDRGSLR